MNQIFFAMALEPPAVLLTRFQNLCFLVVAPDSKCEEVVKMGVILNSTLALGVFTSMKIYFQDKKFRKYFLRLLSCRLCPCKTSNVRQLFTISSGPDQENLIFFILKSGSQKKSGITDACSTADCCPLLKYAPDVVSECPRCGYQKTASRQRCHWNF